MANQCSNYSMRSCVDVPSGLSSVIMTLHRVYLSNELKFCYNVLKKINFSVNRGVDLFLYLLHRTVDGRNEKMVSSRAILSFFTWLSFIYRVEKIGISEKHLEEMLFSSNSFGRAGGTGQAGNDYLIYV